MFLISKDCSENHLEECCKIFLLILEMRFCNDKQTHQQRLLSGLSTKYFHYKFPQNSTNFYLFSLHKSLFLVAITKNSLHKMSFSEEVISSLKGKVIKKNDNRFEYGESNEWTPYNAEMNMQSIKVKTFK